MGEGELSAEVIEKKKLIDNHYYAIANKARPPRTHSPRPIWTTPPSTFLDTPTLALFGHPHPHPIWTWAATPHPIPHGHGAVAPLGLGCNPM